MEACWRSGSSSMRSFRSDSDPTVDARLETQKIDRPILSVYRLIGWAHNWCGPHTTINLPERSTTRAIRYSSIRCGPHDARSGIHRQAIRNIWPSKQIDIVIDFGFGWLTLNRIAFAAKETRQLLPASILGLPSNRERPASLQTSLLDCVARRNVNLPPNCDRTQMTLRFRFKIVRHLKWSEGSRIKNHPWTKATLGELPSIYAIEWRTST